MLELGLRRIRRLFRRSATSRHRAGAVALAPRPPVPVPTPMPPLRRPVVVAYSVALIATGDIPLHGEYVLPATPCSRAEFERWQRAELRSRRMELALALRREGRS
ncbi:hypothetical protein GCM10009654_11320 [Streptomyces hebeiensis]|uniref:Uncharacterized protein n=1 Tax=Streptomyces hebeiensis TaxID=229486 RepID=A0ABN1ULM1_9ACTN